jgi:hypothetical protein
MCLRLLIDHPERELARDTFRGYQAVVTHNGDGTRCGYLRLPAGHPWHGLDYDETPADCHGDITFAEADIPCTAPGPDDAWWVGFDCGHAYDAPDPSLPRDRRRTALYQAAIYKSLYSSLPGMDDFSTSHGTIRTTEFCLDQLRSLAQQAEAAALRQRGV